MNVSTYARTLTKAQQKALLRLYNRQGESRPENQTYRQFRRTGFWEWGRKRNPAFMVPWCRMLVGIEPDGHTHT